MIIPTFRYFNIICIHSRLNITYYLIKNNIITIILFQHLLLHLLLNRRKLAQHGSIYDGILQILPVLHSRLSGLREAVMTVQRYLAVAVTFYRTTSLVSPQERNTTLLSLDIKEKVLHQLAPTMLKHVSIITELNIYIYLQSGLF